MRERERNDKCDVARIVRKRRRLKGQGWEYLVVWEGYEKQSEWTWESLSLIKDTKAMQEFAAEEERRASGRPRESEEKEAPVARMEQNVRYRIFAGLQDQDVPLAAADTVYSVLADAEPVGGKRCRKKGITQGICDLCYGMMGVRTVETTRHIAIECPYNLLAQWLDDMRLHRSDQLESFVRGHLAERQHSLARASVAGYPAPAAQPLSRAVEHLLCHVLYLIQTQAREPAKVDLVLTRQDVTRFFADQ